jgi:hypothetical protein
MRDGRDHGRHVLEEAVLTLVLLVVGEERRDLDVTQAVRGSAP